MVASAVLSFFICNRRVMAESHPPKKERGVSSLFSFHTSSMSPNPVGSTLKTPPPNDHFSFTTTTLAWAVIISHSEDISNDNSNSNTEAAFAMSCYSYFNSLNPHTTLCCVSHLITHLILTKSLRGRYNYYPHSIDEETETQRDYTVCSRSCSL